MTWPWTARISAACGTGVHVLVGDQADPPTLRRWARESGGGFDVIVDDGGHTNRQLLTSFQSLWPQLLPGGRYFMEDLHVGRHPIDGGGGSVPAVADVVQAWMRELAGRETRATPDAQKRWGAAFSSYPEYPLPADAAWLACQPQACVLGKAAYAVGQS